MFKVQHIGSAGQVKREFVVTSEERANRKRDRIRSTFQTGSSEQVRVIRES